MKPNPFKSPFEGYEIKNHISNKNIVVGDYSYYSGYYKRTDFEENVWYLSPVRDDVDKLIIGKYCQIGNGATFIMAGNQGHRADWITTFPFYYDNHDWGKNVVDGWVKKGNTVIGNDVWIGAESMIMPGVNIGDGAIIATRAIVTKDVEPYTIVGGSPAKVIRKRFSDEQIHMLLKIKWWNLPIDIIIENMELFCSDKIEKLYNKIIDCKL